MSLDLSIFNSIHGLAGLSGVFDFFGVFLAYYLPYILGFALLIFILNRKGIKNKLLTFFYLVFTGLVSRYVLTSIVRFILPRERPFDALNFTPLIPESGSSFPSGHAAFFFAIALVLLLIDKKWGMWFLISSIFIGVARIFVGVHWPSDILGGFVVGFLTFIIFKLLFSKNYAPKKEEISKEAKDIDESVQ